MPRLALLFLLGWLLFVGGILFAKIKDAFLGYPDLESLVAGGFLLACGLYIGWKCGDHDDEEFLLEFVRNILKVNPAPPR